MAMANKPEDKKPNEIMEYYRSVWNDKCERAGVDERTKEYFDCLVLEINGAQNKGGKNKKIWNKVEILTIVFAACNMIFAALINFGGTVGTIFKVLTILASALVSVIASYNAYKKPKETWMRHSANYLTFDVETLCFCNNLFYYNGKNDAEAIKLYQERIALSKLNNYENFFSNMGYVKLQNELMSKYYQNKNENIKK